ncbi:MAG: cyclopropane-fatty-acyl-phospholipid synthase family protein [Chloroflexota bacterium]|nr:cyclopropane-fatty-acyl-phospholipid synthase family protein [Chloroflexota bacterium]
MGILGETIGRALAPVVLKNMSSLGVKVTTPDGNSINGEKGDSFSTSGIEVTDWSFFVDLILGYDLGLADAYINRKWNSGNLPGLFKFLASRSHDKRFDKYWNLAPWKIIARVKQSIRSTNSLKWAKKNISAHYDMSNEWFSLFLDSRMNYSCAEFSCVEDNLDQAQDRKLDFLLSNSNIKENDHILDIGCGWGGLIFKAAKDYGCKATGVTLSRNQYEYCSMLVEKLDLSDRVKILLQDYRSLNGKFDHIYAIEMLEAVGHNGLRDFFNKTDELLQDSGTLNLQVITVPDDRYEEYRKNCDFIQKYIFPGGLLPSERSIKYSASTNSDFVIKTNRSIGEFYPKTLINWRNNLFGNLKNAQRIGFSENDIRRFDYYFSYCAGAFEAQHIDNRQIVMSRS